MRNMRCCVVSSEGGGKVVLTSGSANITEIKVVTEDDASAFQLWVEKIKEQLGTFGSGDDIRL